MTKTQALLFLPCAGGVEALLAAECERLLGRPVRAMRGGVEVRGGLDQAMLLNLHSRLAQRVLWLLADGPYRNEVDLYDLARRVDWTRWITPEQTLRVDSTAHRSPLTSLNFANLRIKDAVCDALREATGSRPSVDTRHPTLSLALHLTDSHAYLYADTSGQALFKRGWRDVSAKGGAKTGEAPLKETLAAAMLAAAGWRGRVEDGPLFDPCCGAGTIAIEAAQMACGMAPGLHRRFAFEQMLPWRDALVAWREMKAAAQAGVHAGAVPVHAGDVSFRMTDFAAANARLAGVAQAISFKTADALQRLPPEPQGTLILNPPYGERITAKGRHAAAGERIGAGGRGWGQREGFEGGGAPAEFFGQLAAHWKRQYPGWTAWVLSPEMKLPSLMRLKETRRVPMYNGPIECRLFRFDIVAGSARG